MGALLLKTADIPCSAYFEFLYRQMEEYPVITVNGWRNGEGAYHAWAEKDMFEDYRMLQYYYLFD